jgi:putative hydrolase of the HAD superfamily
MIGNSVRSDVLPVMAIGGHAVHVPYHITWELERVDDHGEDVVELSSIAEVPAWLGLESEPEKLDPVDTVVGGLVHDE